MTEEAIRWDPSSSRPYSAMTRHDQPGNVRSATDLAVVNPFSDKVHVKDEDSHDKNDLEYGINSNWSVSKLITYLRYAFRPKDFAKVEAILVEREEQSELKIEKLNEERLDKMSLEIDLRKCRKECEELRNTMSKLREENMLLREREKLAEERCNNLLEKVKRLGEKEHELIDLRSKNYELELAKEKVEGELELVMKRFKELEERVLSLEGDMPLLRDETDMKSDDFKVVSRKSEIGRVEATVKVKEVSFVPSCDSPADANGSEKPTSQKIVDIVDMEGDKDSAPVQFMRGKRTTDPAENSHSDQICVENGAESLKRKRTLSVGRGESKIGDDVDNTLHGELKMKKLQGPVCRPDDCPVNHCSTKTISSDGNEVSKGFGTPRKDSIVSRQSEQQTGSELKSQDLMNGLSFNAINFLEESEESSSVSESDSDDDSIGGCTFPSIFSLPQNFGDKTESGQRK